MYLRSLAPDSIADNLKVLAGLIIRENGVFKKAKDDGELENHFDDILTSHKGMQFVGSELFKAFTDAQDDFNKGRIQQAIYKSHLKKFNDFFEINDLTKLNLPSTMNADVILKEIARFI